MTTFDATVHAYLVHDLAAAPHTKTAKEWAADARRAPTAWHRGLYSAVAAKVADATARGIVLAPRAAKKPWHS